MRFGIWTATVVLVCAMSGTVGCSHSAATATDDAAARKAFSQGGTMPDDVKAKMEAAKANAAKKYGQGGAPASQ